MTSTGADTRPRTIRRRLSTTLAIGRLVPAYVAFGILRHIVPIERLVRLAWRRPAGPPLSREDAARLVAGTTRLRQILGNLDRDCLPRSLLLYRELCRGGRAPSLAIGFARRDGRLVGHAWVTLGGDPLDARERVDDLAVTCVFGPDARRMDPAGAAGAGKHPPSIDSPSARP